MARALGPGNSGVTYVWLLSVSLPGSVMARRGYDVTARRPPWNLGVNPAGAQTGRAQCPLVPVSEKTL